jgi:hypothetical protein
LSTPLSSDITQAAFTPERLAEIRQAVFADGVVSPLGIDLLFATVAAHGDAGPSGWPELFADAVATFVVDQSEPAGFVSDANVDWLIQRVASDHRVFCKTEFAALVEVLRRARSVPDRLVAFSLGLLRDAIVSAEGPLVEPGRRPGLVTPADVEALRDVLYAAASEGFGHVTRAEADILFDIARAAGTADHDPGFDDLFARAIGNHLLANVSHHVPAMAEALRRERWLDERQSLTGGLGGLFSRVLTCVISGDGFVSAAGSWLARDAAQSVLASQEVITRDEQAWLEAQLARCDPGSRSVRMLKSFLEREAPASIRALDAVA